MLKRHGVSVLLQWAMTAGYIVNGLGLKVLQCFIQAQDAGVWRDLVIYTLLEKVIVAS